jgi:iron(III) transport system ATP-binding protein
MNITAAAPFLRIRDLTKRFGAFTALRDISLEIHQGEFVCFLGPSGCGKTTLLRAIAGLDPQDEGTIEIGGRDVSNLPPAARDYGIVFQSYALFPNLTVAANVGYGLVNQRKSRAAIDERVNELLTLVGLRDQEKKYPVQLSGGQQQRVALARALATSPGLLLLDEPLSALDARVRVRLREEIRALQRRLGVTTIMVTHDQEEALSMADRIVVMNQGAIEQVGTPEEIYRKPATAFVADFVGAMTFLDGKLAAPRRVSIGNIELACADDRALPSGTALRIGFRPEEVKVRNLAADTPNRLAARIDQLEFLGSFCRARLALDDAPGVSLHADFSANLMHDLGLAEGQPLTIALPPDALRVFAKG